MNTEDLLKTLSGKVDIDTLRSRIKVQNKMWEKGIGLDFIDALSKYKNLKAESISYQDGAVVFNGNKASTIEQALNSFGHWRKGPFQVMGTDVDSEWRSDFKWNRLVKHLPDLSKKDILDIGCNNGYFMYRMLEHNPKSIFGIDPTIQYKAQFDFLYNLYPNVQIAMEMLGVEDLTAFDQSFDIIFSMGILYHHRSPLQQLFDIRMALKAKGILILETIILPGESEEIITPVDKYAGMGNVWLLPTKKALINWLQRSKFIDIEIINVGWESELEQRSTKWSAPKSYSDFISGDRTIEGYPAPERMILKATRK